MEHTFLIEILEYYYLIINTVKQKCLGVFFIPKIKNKGGKAMILQCSNKKIYLLLRRLELYRVHPRYTKAVKILLAVVIGALLLAGLYALFGETVLPTLTQRIKEMFNYGG